MKDEKIIGENTTKFDLNDKVREPWIGEINTNRLDSNFKYGYVNPSIPYQSLGFQMAYSNHDQRIFLWIKKI